MRLLITLLLLIFATKTQANPPAGKINIKGKISSLNQDFLLIDKLGATGTLSTDTILVKKGKFLYSKEIEGEHLFSLYSDANDKIILSLKPGQSVKMKIKAPKISKNYSVAGSPSSIAIKKYYDSIYWYTDKIQELKDGDITTNSYGLKRYLYLKGFKKMSLNYIKANPNSIISLIAIPNIPKDEEVETMKMLVSGLEGNEEYASYVENLKSNIAFIESQTKDGNPTIGTTAPDLAYKNPTGDEMKLSDLKGKFVLLDFWASWCGPCRRENPNVVKLYEKYKNAGFDIFSYSLDQNKQRWIQAIEKDKLTWTNHVSDLKGWSAEGARKYKVRSIPQTFLLDPDGKIIAVNLRGHALEKKLEELFKF